MDGTEAVTPPAEPIAPPVESDSLADHEAQFAPGTVAEPEPAAKPAEPEGETPTEGERDVNGRFKPRHRAKSQEAGAGDVPRIAELTRKLREAERRAEEAERRATAAPPAAAERREPARSEPGLAAPASSFPDKEPTLTDFEGEADPYAAWMRAVGRYDRKKEAWEADTAARAEREKAAQLAAHAEWTKNSNDYYARDAAFAKTHPDYEDVIAADTHTEPIPPSLGQAIFKSDKSAEIKYYLAQHPEFFDEMLLLTEGKPLSDSLVALTQRRLVQRVQAASTGSAAAARSPNPAPRPPNPVRTGPIQTGDDPPGDESSLAAHEKAYGKKSR